MKLFSHPMRWVWSLIAATIAFGMIAGAWETVSFLVVIPVLLWWEVSAIRLSVWLWKVEYDPATSKELWPRSRRREK